MDAKLRRDGLFWMNEQGRQEGPRAEIRGRIGKVWGDCSRLTGDVSGLKGNVTGIIGDASGVRGDIEECNLTQAERDTGVQIESLIRVGAGPK